jgi:acetylornithine deacetylase
VPFSTASVGQFHGGIADNVVPRDAEFRYEFRDLPTADARAMQQQVVAYARSLEPAMKKVAPDTGFRFETICEIPSFLGSAQDDVTRLAQRLAGEPRTTNVAFGTEAGIFKNAGIRTVVCGPGSIVAGAPAGRIREPGAAGALPGVHAGPGGGSGTPAAGP